MEDGMFVFDQVKMQSYKDRFLKPIVEGYNALTNDARRALLVEANTDPELIDAILEDNNDLTIEYLEGYLYDHEIGLDLDKIFFLLTGTKYTRIPYAGKKRRILFKENNNNSNNNNGIRRPPPPKRIRPLNLTIGGSKKHKKRKSRTMKKRK